MAYNTTYAKYKSTYLAALDCTPTGAIKGRRQSQSDVRYFATFTVPAGTQLEPGQCIAMMRIPAGTTVTGGQLAWNVTGSAQIALGDPYGCARLVGACFTCLPNNLVQAPSGGAAGTCGLITKVSVAGIGDGCGIGYTYTCETDLVVTNLYSEANAAVGGWAGGAVFPNGGTAGAALTAGTITVVLEVLPV